VWEVILKSAKKPLKLKMPVLRDTKGNEADTGGRHQYLKVAHHLLAKLWLLATTASPAHHARYLANRQKVVKSYPSKLQGYGNGLGEMDRWRYYK
jgi:hypothetical protein